MAFAVVLPFHLPGGRVPYRAWRKQEQPGERMTEFPE